MANGTSETKGLGPRDAYSMKKRGVFIIISSRFGTDEFAAIAKGIAAVVRRYPDGIPGAVVYVTRPAR